jgi:hypothetical protein
MTGNGDGNDEWNRFLQNTCTEELCTLKTSGSSEPNLQMQEELFVEESG